MASPLRAQQFQVFCVSNNDGTVSCQGWRGGETLTCISSRGGVSSCSTPSGRRFTCVIEPGGVTTCSDPRADGSGRPDTDCTFTGDGNFTCTPPRPPSQPLLPGPRLIPSTGLPSLPTTPPVITNPSVFDP
ncbi:hypothetical protein NZK33_02015 [Cyanobium sp. FGCU-6]|nr:hypothetical protein [Cyanobium sp. FGCU6]